MKALSDIVMLDLTHMLSGPFAAMLLADLGAQTIKVEPPGSGEMTRGLLADDPRYGYKGMGPYFRTLNRNKKSTCIDLKRDGRAVLSSTRSQPRPTSSSTTFAPAFPSGSASTTRRSPRSTRASSRAA